MLPHGRRGLRACPARGSFRAEPLSALAPGPARDDGGHFRAHVRKLPRHRGVRARRHGPARGKRLCVLQRRVAGAGAVASMQHGARDAALCAPGGSARRARLCEDPDRRHGERDGGHRHGGARPAPHALDAHRPCAGHRHRRGHPVQRVPRRPCDPAFDDGVVRRGDDTAHRPLRARRGADAHRQPRLCADARRRAEDRPVAPRHARGARRRARRSSGS